MERSALPFDLIIDSFETNLYNRNKWIDGPLVKCIHSRQRVTLAHGIHEYEILEVHYRNVSRVCQVVKRSDGTCQPSDLWGTVHSHRVSLSATVYRSSRG